MVFCFKSTQLSAEDEDQQVTMAMAMTKMVVKMVLNKSTGKNTKSEKAEDEKHDLLRQYLFFNLQLDASI